MKSINLLEQFKEFLKNENVVFIERFGQHPSVNLKFQGENGLLFVTIHFFEQKKTLVCFSDFPIRIQKSKRNEVFEFLSVINVQSLITTFILDYDGYLRAKSSLFSCESEITPETFRRFLYVNVASLNTHFKKILLLAKISYSDKNTIQNQISLN